MIRRRIASGQFAVIDRVPYPKKYKGILLTPRLSGLDIVYAVGRDS